MYRTRSYITKADLSINWREPPSKKDIPITLNTTTNFRTRAFPKKNVSPVNPFPSYLWQDFTDYRVGLKCELCKTTIRKSVFPQQTDCGHIFCAHCIHTHYNIEHKLKCPTCTKYINEQDDPAYCRRCYEAPCECWRNDRDDEDDCCPGCGDRYCNGRCDDDTDREDDGVLGCGCIDVCRGRCDSDDYFGGW